MASLVSSATSASAECEEDQHLGLKSKVVNGGTVNPGSDESGLLFISDGGGVMGWVRSLVRGRSRLNLQALELGPGKGENKPKCQGFKIRNT